MGRTVEVTLKWKIGVPGISAPLGEQFSRPVRFDHQGEDWAQDAWSLTLQMKGKLDENSHQSGIAHFLMPEAPQEWLSAGRRFSLYEGRVIAEGEIVKVLEE